MPDAPRTRAVGDELSQNLPPVTYFEPDTGQMCPLESDFAKAAECGAGHTQIRRTAAMSFPEFAGQLR